MGFFTRMPPSHPREWRRLARCRQDSGIRRRRIVDDTNRVVEIVIELQKEYAATSRPDTQPNERKPNIPGRADWHSSARSLAYGIVRLVRQCLVECRVKPC